MPKRNGDDQVRSSITRFGAGFLGLSLAALILAQGAAQVLASERPHLALLIAPWFAPAHARAAELASASDPVVAARQAQAALRRDATSVPALRTLGQIDAGAAGTQLLSLAEKLSRRDLATHLLLIERDAAGGDLNSVLRHYDQALRTDEGSWSLLIPALVKATAAPQVIAPLARQLANNPQWMFPFYREWVKSAPDSRTMVALSRVVGSLGHPLNRDVRVGLLARLITEEDWAGLRDELERAGIACNGTACIDGDFRRLGALVPVDWSPGSADRALIVRAPLGTGRFALDYSFTGPGDIIIARRLVQFPAGTYASAFDFRPASGSPPDRPFITFECADRTGASLPTAQDARWARAVVKVPVGCPTQWMTIRFSSSTPDQVSGRIMRIRVEAR